MENSPLQNTVPQGGGAAGRSLTVYSADIRLWRQKIERELRGENPTVSVERIERAKRFLREEDAHRCVGAELLLRCALERKTGSSVGELRTGRDDNGKPFLTDFPGLHFNLSHSGQIVLCAIDFHPVGVDVEEIRDIGPDVAAACFTPAERKRLEGTRGEAWLNEFYLLWTLKESYLKALGTGLRRNPLSVEVAPQRVDSPLWEAKGDSTYKLHVLPVPAGYVAAVCSRGEFTAEIVG